jgi:hypothetical protein
MREQLAHLLAVGRQRNVQVQIMRAGCDFHPGMNGSMVVLESLEHRHYGYFESQGEGVVVTNPAKVSSFGLRHGKLRTQALNVEESARLIERLAGEA